MMYGTWNGWGWGWMTLMPVLWIILIGVIIWAALVLATRRAEPPVREDRPNTPQAILDHRFASGEIDAESYARARDLLRQGHRES